MLSKLPTSCITRQCTAKSIKQLFYNIAGGIVHQIRHEKRTTISEVIVRGKRNIKQNRNWFYFKFSVESSSFILQTTLSFVWFYQSVFLSKFVAFRPRTVKRIVTALMPSPFSASFKNSSPREKVAKSSSFWDWWAESLFVSIIVAKYNIFSRANNGRPREKKNF